MKKFGKWIIKFNSVDLFSLFCLISIFIVVAYFSLNLGSRDFCQDYISITHFLNGRNIYGVFDSQSVVNCMGLNFNAHNPFTILILSPLGLFGLKTATNIWTIFSSIIFFGTYLYLFNAFDLPKHKLLSSFLFLAFVVVDFISMVIQKNLDQITFFLLVFGFIRLEKNKYLSGIFLGFASLIKVWPLIIVLGLLITGRVRQAVVSMCTMILGLMIILFTFKFSDLVVYEKLLHTQELTWLLHPLNYSIISALTKWLYFYIHFTLQNAYCIGFLVGLFLILISLTAVRLFYKKDKSLKDVSVFSYLFFISILVYPIFWSWEMPIFILPLLIFFKYISSNFMIFKTNAKYFIPLGLIWIIDLPALFSFQLQFTPLLLLWGMTETIFISFFALLILLTFYLGIKNKKWTLSTGS